MKKNKVLHKSELIFEKWLSANMDRFNNKPTTNGKGGFYFEGITQAINLYIDFGQPEAMLHLDNIETKENYDLCSIQWIGKVEHDPLKGFYDADRIDSIYTYYDTYEELIIIEVFEEIIEYCNNNFVASNSLYLIDYEGSTEGFIAPTDESKNTSKLNMLRRLKHKSNRDIQYIKYDLINQT